MNINIENKEKKHRCHICEDSFDNIELHFLNEHSNEGSSEIKKEDKDSESQLYPDDRISIIQEQRSGNEQRFIHFLNENANENDEIIKEVEGTCSNC